MIPNAHITIYNKYIDVATRTEKYQRSEIYNCVWQASRSVSRFKEQVQSNTLLVLIPFASDTGYQEPKAWQIDRDGWTLQEGDIVVRGLVTDEIDTEYRVSDLRTEHQNVFAIASIACMDNGSPNVNHWELNCK